MNTETPLVSIILPVYNVEKWIEDCIQSLVHQSYVHWEAIFVIDGSLDYSAEICKRYEAVDQRFRVYEQANAGQGAARNAGVSKAYGKYLLFLDPDDLITENGLQLMVDRAEALDADIVVGDFNVFEDGQTPPAYHANAGEYFKSVFADYPVTFIRANIDDDLFYNSLYFMVVWMKLFKRETWIASDIHAPAGMTMGEDFTTVKKMAFKSKRIAIVDTVIVNYRKRKGSATTKRSLKAYGIFQSYPLAVKMYKEMNVEEYEMSYLHKCYMHWYLNHLFNFTPLLDFNNFYKKIRAELLTWGNSNIKFDAFDDFDHVNYNRILNNNFGSYVIVSGGYIFKLFLVQCGVKFFRIIRQYAPQKFIGCMVSVLNKSIQKNQSSHPNKFKSMLIKHLTTG